MAATSHMSALSASSLWERLLQATIQGQVTLQRRILSDTTFLGQAPYQDPGLKPPGPDNSSGGFLDTNVGTGAPGEVFDLDPPGVGPGQSVGAPERLRVNFQEYAMLGGRYDDNPPQVGIPFAYYVAVSCGGTSAAPSPDNTVAGDNVAAADTIPLTWNLH